MIRAVLRGRIQEVQVELTTVYEPEPRLDMWVPALFREHYQFGVAPTSRSIDSRHEYERVVCEARYTNYRRFETSLRIR